MNVWNARFRAAIITLATLTMTAATLAGVLVRPALADGTTYSAAKRQFKVGILLLESTIDANLDGNISNAEKARGPENPDPYVFYIADSRADVKPSGWEFVNPLAPGTVTPDVRARWTARDPSQLYRVGQKVTKNMAAYWEVSLYQASIQQLLQYDLLFITNHRRTAFSPAEREKLRKVVDAGGIVWIENCGGMTIDKQSPFFLEQLSFVDGGPVGTPVINKPDHPLLNTPYRLTFDEVNNLGDKRYTSYMVSLDDKTLPPNPEILVNIVGVKGTNLPYIAAGNYGGGTVIATASDCGCDINDYIGGVNAGSGGNSGAYSGSNFSAAHTEDLKFLYNMVSWGSSAGDFRRNTRRVGASFGSVGAPLVPTFSFSNDLTQNAAIQANLNDIADSRTSGVIANGAYFFTGTQGGKITVRAYDLNPLRDLDGDGNSDDGLADLSLGLPYDEIWRWDGPAASETEQASPPVFASVLTTTGREERIYVTLPDGTLLALQAFPRGAGGSFLAAPGVATVAGTGGTYSTNAIRAMPRGVAPAPVFFENRIYQIEPNGLVRCINADVTAPGNPVLWTSFKTAPGNINYRATGTPAVGFIRQSSEVSPLSRNSGGSTNDLMMYIPARVQDSPNPTTNQPFARAQMLAYWLGTRNEVLRFGNDPEASGGVIKTRVAGGVAGGPSEGQYFVARPGDNAPLGSFLKPRVRVFAANLNSSPPVTAQDNYNAGRPTAAYSVVPINDLPIAEDGRITLKRDDMNYPAPGAGADILVAADYDVMYISGKTGTVPPNYAANTTQVGARPNQLLNISGSLFRNANDALLPFNQGDNYNRGYASGTFSTPAIAADDTLLFAAIQAQNLQSPALNQSLPTIFAALEQEGDFLSPTNSRIRWRYPIINDADGLGNTTPYVTRLVDDVTVTDLKPFIDILPFDPKWPSPISPMKPVLSSAGTVPALRDIHVIGTPITTNEGITYFLAQARAINDNIRGGIATILMAFQTNPDIVLNLPEPFDLNAGVTVQQADLFSLPAANPPGVVRASSNQVDNPQFTLDADRGRIVIKNFRGSGSGFSASQSFVVRYYSRDGRAERKTIISPIPTGAGESYGKQVDATGRLSGTPGGFTPLLFYYVLPGQPVSAPTLIGDYIYYNARIAGQNNDGKPYIIAAEARPFSTDPTIRLGFAEPVLKVADHVKVTQLPLRSDPATRLLMAAEGSPVGGEGSLVVNTVGIGNQIGVGVAGLNNGLTLIADSRRLIEVGADSSALWSLDSTISSVIAGGPLPIFGRNGEITNAPAPGRLNQSRQGLARPMSLQRIGGSDYLLADAGNNRVVRADRGGNVVWSLTKAADPYQILAPGDPLTLNEPTDLLYYITPSLDAANAAVTGYEVHYLIADSGNSRIIEVANYYNKDGAAIDAPGSQGGGTKGQSVVVWVSRVASEQGKELKFKSVQRYIGFGPDGTDFAGFYGYPYLTAVVSNVRLGIDGPAADAVGGSLVTMRYAPYNTSLPFRDAAGAQKPGRLWQPAATGSARQTEPAGNGATLIALSEFTIITPDGKTRTKRINNPTFFQQLNLPAKVNTGNPAKTLYLLCDLDGAFVLQARTRGGKPVLDALWQFSQTDYDLMNVGNGTTLTGRLTVPGGQEIQSPKFLPVSMQLLANGNYLITNGWTGRSPLFKSGNFSGEVVEVQPTGAPVLVTTPFTFTSFGGAFSGFSAPRINAGGTLIPTLNEQIMGSGDGNTGLLEQPIFAIRP